MKVDVCISVTIKNTVNIPDNYINKHKNYNRITPEGYEKFIRPILHENGQLYGYAELVSLSTNDDIPFLR